MGTSSSSNPTPSGKDGETWGYKLYFDPEANDETGVKYDNIKDGDLMNTLKELVQYDEKINKVTAFWVPLHEYLPHVNIFGHVFIVFETDHYFWSIEKHTDGITIQRSWKLSAVRDRYRRSERRKGIRGIKSDEGRFTVHKLIEGLYDRKELRMPYHWFSSNCQDFAKAVFNNISDKETLSF